MSAWTSTELAAVDRADEIEVSTLRGHGTLRTSRIVWVVRREESFYVRSVNGPEAAWYRGVRSRHCVRVNLGQLSRHVTFVEAGEDVGDDPELDDAPGPTYPAKYERWTGPVNRITTQPARGTTLLIDPA